MLVTVRCPADGVVGVSVSDLRTVVVRSGSDVEVTYACPLCGSPIVVSSNVEPGLVAMLGPFLRRRAHGGDKARRSAYGAASFVPLRRREDLPRIEAYAEYFRRELARADTADTMISEMDAPRR